MSLYSYDPYTRYRKRSLSRLMNIVFFVSAVFMASGIGFWLGRQMEAQRNISLSGRVAELQGERDSLQNSLTALRAEAQTATMRLEETKRSYEERIPAGPMDELVTLVKKQLDEGMDPQRMAFVIRSARPPRNCVEPQTRRFVISTPAYEGPDSQIEISEGPIVIKGRGVAATNEKGAQEAWYDPAKSVAIEFSANGQTEKKEGVMPLHHSIVAGNREYRFTVEAGARSFAKVVFDSCDYP